jgi:hypothetical protein
MKLEKCGKIYQYFPVDNKKTPSSEGVQTTKL